jgi:hypothetical protein
MGLNPVPQYPLGKIQVPLGDRNNYGTFTGHRSLGIVRAR